MLTAGKVAYDIGGNVDAMWTRPVSAGWQRCNRLGLAERIDDRLHL
jgi:hypothetical protein